MITVLTETSGLKVFGLTVDQIEMVLDYYIAHTGKDPRVNNETGVTNG